MLVILSSFFPIYITLLLLSIIRVKFNVWRCIKNQLEGRGQEVRRHGLISLWM